MGQGVKGDEIPDEHSICRLIKGIHYDAETQTVLGAAFFRTPQDDDGLSVNWLEHVDQDATAALVAILGVLRKKREVKNSYRFVRWNVGEAGSKAAPEGGMLAEHDPIEGVNAKTGVEWADPSHSLLVYGMANHMAVGEALAECLSHIGEPVGPA